MGNAVTNIALLGSTGSIGRNTLEVISHMPDRFHVSCLSTNTNIDLLIQQISQFKPHAVCVYNHQRANELRNNIPDHIKILTGNAGLMELVRRDDVNLVVNSLVGFVGLQPTVEAIRHKKHIALANKETLVVAGELVTSIAKEYGVHLLPIDSEHSAILQCLAGEHFDQVSKLIITASGGPFYQTPKEQFPSITVDAALNHPNWKMGKKITIDSATLMNKGLEVIEARWLFDIPADRIDVVVHPQSIIHSMVEFIDGSIKAQLGIPDMKLPIQYALTFPQRLPLQGPRIDFPSLQSMTFFKPDKEKFRCLQLAFDALSIGGTAPAIMNAANEIAVEAFLQHKISFTKIPEYIERALQMLPNHRTPDFEHIIEADTQARTYVRTLC